MLIVQMHLCLFQAIGFQLKSVECHFVSIATSSIKAVDIDIGWSNTAWSVHFVSVSRSKRYPFIEMP